MASPGDGVTESAVVSVGGVGEEEAGPHDQAETKQVALSALWAAAPTERVSIVILSFQPTTHTHTHTFLRVCGD